MKDVPAEQSRSGRRGTVHTIRADSLVKTYGDVRALDGLSFTVEPGEVFGLLGPNGAGKSTTIKILTTLSSPTQGAAFVAGHDVSREPDAVRRHIGVVTQKASTDPMATGTENLLLAGHIQGLRGAAARQRAEELLSRFSLTEAANRLVKTYSGGMQRKLDVAIGLVHRPSVLFLDEPTTGLDPEARAEMWAEIARLAAQEQITILLTTHYLDEADHLAHRLAIIDHGRLVATGTPEELKSGLRGDAVVVELGPEADLALASATITALPGTSSLTIEGRQVRARVEHGASAVPGVLNALDGIAVPVVSITVARPSLDDVYLQHTGRTLGSVEGAVAA